MKIVLLAAAVDGSTSEANRAIFRSKIMQPKMIGDHEYVLCSHGVEYVEHDRIKYVEEGSGFFSFVKEQLALLSDATEITLICSHHEWSAIQEEVLTKPKKIVKVSAAKPVVFGDFDLLEDDVEVIDELSYLSTLGYRTVKGSNVSLVWDGKKHFVHTVVYVPE